MYEISNQQMQDLLQYLDALRDLPAKSTRVHNLKRKASLLRDKLAEKATVKKISTTGAYNAIASDKLQDK